MRNIHLIPTDKPSRIFKDDFGKLIYSINIDQEQNHFHPQHIYITNSEKTKQGDSCIDKYNVVYKQETDKIFSKFTGSKKIILTTDQDLIKDSVQAIDDEFLEWFAKNPSCEEVEVIYDSFEKTGNISIWEYEIIIPKEEPKQETIEEYSERLAKAFDNDNYKPISQLIIDGANFQSERMYSEEEVINICEKLIKEKNDGSKRETMFFILNDWFSQFKKK